MQESAINKQLKRLRSLKKQVKAAKLKAEAILNTHPTGRKAGYQAHSGRFIEPIKNRAEYMKQYAQYRTNTEACIEELLAEAASLPVATAQKWDRPRDVKIAIIADAFLFDSIEVAADFIPLTPENFEAVVPTVDVLLIVSAWRGLKDEWYGAAQKNSPNRRLIEDAVIPLAKANEIPVVFYSKEDPPNYKAFLSLAKLADFVFTSAEEMIPQYREDIGSETPIKALRFGVNYKKHNPLGCQRHKGREVVFAGSWMSHKYPERAEAAEKIFDGVNQSDSDLFIIDRNLNLDPKKFKNVERYLYPSKYLKNLHGPLSHDQVLRLQKLLPLAINLNSVVTSQTMFANRAVELQAMGTLVLSNYSAGLNSRYPQITMLDSEVDTELFLGTLTDEYLSYCQVEGIREVFLNDTTFERVDEILEAVGIEATKPDHNVYIVSDSKRRFEEFRDSQSTESELKWITPNDLDRVEGSEYGDILIFIDRIPFNGPDLVNDAIATFRYSDADVLKYAAFDDYQVAYEPTSSYLSKDSGHVYWLPGRQTFPNLAVKKSMLIKTSVATRPVNIVGRKEPEISIIVPTYNNGRHLIHKCFQSLVRSNIFPKSEIIIVDDGSTDLKTQKIVDLIEQLYPNVKVYRYPVGGSGSASRPRNKGLELASTPYVTYLDPDNEQLNDAFARLLDLAKKNNRNFAIGNMIRFKGRRSTVNNSRFLKNAMAKSPSLNGENAELLKQLNYKPMSIQALVADTQWLKSLRLIQPVGAVGQDSYFFQQMLFYADSVSVTTLPVHVYYAEVSNSTVNSISPKFYRKYIPLEESRSSWLDSIGLKEHYIETRFRDFLKLWYIEKLKYVSAEDRQECVAIIEEITSLYGIDIQNDQEIKGLLDDARTGKYVY